MAQHKMTMRRINKRILESYCMKKGCRYYGKRAQQGICFNNKGELVEWRKIAFMEKRIVGEMKEIYKNQTLRQRIRWLESMYVSAMLNWQVGLDEVVRLRKDLALARPRRRK